MIKKLEGYSKEIFFNQYSYPGEKSWADRAKVIAKQAASAEKDEDKEKIQEKFYKAISSGDLVPGGRIIFGAGRNRGKYNLLNCYVLQPNDNVESLGKFISDAYRISCGGGGIGTNISKIRPIGDDIGNVSNSAPRS